MQKTLGIGLMLGWQDIRKSYKRSALGQIWITLGMAVTIGAIGIVFSTLFNSPMGTFLPFLASGLITWALMAGILNEGSQSFISAEGMIKQIALPKTVYIVRVVWKNLIIFGHNLVILPFVYLIVGFEPSWTMLLWPLGLILTVLSVSGLAISLAVVSTRFRDLPQIVSAILSVAFYLTPIIWGLDRAGSSPIVDAVLAFNPFTHVLQVSRLPLIGEAPSIENYFVACVAVFLSWGMALIVYRKFRHRIAYWV